MEIIEEMERPVLDVLMYLNTGLSIDHKDWTARPVAKYRNHVSTAVQNRLLIVSEHPWLESPLAAECSGVQASAHPDPVPIFERMGSRLPNQASHCAQSMPSPLEVSSQ